MKIEELKTPQGANKKSKRVGRGGGSGHGKTSCRGHKGALARSGKRTWTGFEGGQMPLIRRMPKRGFTNKRTKRFQIVNIGQLTKFAPANLITAEELFKQGLIKKKNMPVKLLGKGELKKGLKIELTVASRGAQKKIEDAGGEFKSLKNAKSVN